MGDATDTLNADLVTPDEAEVLAKIAGGGQPPESISAPLVDPNAPLRTDGPTLAEYVAAGYVAESYPPAGYAARESIAPVLTAEPLAPVPESWRACTGQDIQAMLKASQAGFVRTPGFTRADVYAFVASKGLL